MENWNDEHPELRYDYCLLTLERNNYSDTVKDPMFEYSVTDVRCLSVDEYDSIVGKFSRNELLPVAETYARFVTDNYKVDGSGDYPGATLGFKTAFVDEDDIPELLTAQGNDHMATVKIYA